MKKSFIGGMALGAFLVSLIPYRVQAEEGLTLIVISIWFR